MILLQILEHKTSEVEERAATFPLAEIQARAKAASPARVPDFSATMSLIAEVKRRSPSQGDIVSAFDPVAQARACQAGGASAISVLTDSRFFGGCFDDLSAVRQAVSVPILCKDFILTPYQLYEARAYGADLVLLIVAALNDAQLWEFQALARDLGMTPLVEVHDQHDLARAVAAEASLIGINNRDLSDFSVDLMTTEYLAPLIPDETTVVSESGIATREDVARAARAGARVILVGETLMRSPAPAATIRELLR